MLYSFRVHRDASMSLEWQIATPERSRELVLARKVAQSCWADLIHPDERDLMESRRHRLLSGSPSIDEVQLCPIEDRRTRLRLYGRPEVQGGRVVRVTGGAEEIAADQPPALTPEAFWNRESSARLLMRELEHRLQNVLSTVQALVLQTLSSSPSPEAFAEAISGRLQALGTAQTLLTRGGWRGAMLEDLVREELAPYRPADGGIAVAGAAVSLTPDAALALSLALHELATNAAKYGALSVPEGRVGVAWTVEEAPEGQRLVLTWTERGGPAVRVPERRGFGSALIERSITYRPGGTVRLEFPPSGVRCRIEIPLDIEREA